MTNTTHHKYCHQAVCSITGNSPCDPDSDTGLCSRSVVEYGWPTGQHVLPCLSQCCCDALQRSDKDVLEKAAERVADAINTDRPSDAAWSMPCCEICDYRRSIVAAIRGEGESGE